MDNNDLKYSTQWMREWRKDPINRLIDNGRCKKWRDHNKEKKLELNRQYRAANPDKVAKWRENHRSKQDKGKARERANKYWRKLKFEVMMAYSNGDPRCMCSGCNVNELAFLTLDHINNDGGNHRKIIAGGTSLYLYLRKNNFPQDPPLQILCWNCNEGKRFGNGICVLFGKSHVK